MSRQAHEKEISHDGRLRKFKPYEVGVQIPRGVHPEVSTKNDIRGLGKHLGEVFKRLAEQKESRIEEGHLLSDHVHMLIAIPPKYAVSQVVGFIKGKSAIHLARVYGERRRSFVGKIFGPVDISCRQLDGTGGDPGVHPAAGGRGQATGPTKPGILTATDRVAKTSGAALASPQ